MKSKYIWLIIILGLLLYSRALFNGFVWDDEEQIVNNAAVHTLASIPSFFSGSTFNEGGTGRLGGVYYRPVMMIVFAVLYSVSGAGAFVFHLFQILIHIASCVLLYLIFRRFFKEGTAALLSLVYLVHPVNVESVAYIAAIQDAVYVFFILLCFYCYLTRKPGRLTTGIIAASVMIAMLSKEVAVVFITVFLTYLFALRDKRRFLYAGVSAAAVCAYLVLRFAVAQVFFTPFHFAPIVNTTLWQRMLMAPAIFFSYMGMIVWPQKLSVMQHWIIRDVTVFTFYLPAAAILAAVVGAVYIYIKTKSSTFLLFVLWFTFGIAPYMQLFPLDMTVAERWLYFPFIGLLGTAGFLIESAGKRVPRRAGLAIGVLILVLLSVRTFVRIGDWRDSYTLFTHDVRLSPGAFDLENNVGVALFRQGDITGARRHFLESGRLAPGWWVNWNNVGATYQRTHDYENALKYYKRSLKNGDYYLAYENYASTLIILKRYPEARSFLTSRAMRIFPYNQNLRDLYTYLETVNK